MSKKSQKTKYIYPIWCLKGEKCWICDQKSQQPFRKAIIQSTNGNKILCKLENGKVQDVKLECLQPRSASTIAYKDLMDVNTLNNPQLLHQIKLNFEERNIYTYVGPTLLITNPYKYFPQLYTKQLRLSYIKNIIEGPNLITNKEFSPHIYGVVAQAIKDLYSTNKNQSILISGESGAGKTEANKQCMRFLAEYFHSGNQKEQSLQDKILSCNPVLEAFGNAKTIRNDNSSRFGKFIEIQINIQDQKIIKAIILNYLLQKSRVTSQLDQQRNFHIFYYFLFGITKQQRAKYGIPLEFKIDDFDYLKNTKKLPKDDKMLKQIKDALQVLHFQNIQDSVWRVLASILHLGNLLFQQQNKDEIRCQIVNIDTLNIICQLLKLQKNLLIEALISYKMKVGNQSLTKYFNQKQIKVIRDSLSRALYQKLFTWLVNALNLSLCKQEISVKTKKSLRTIGLLDIYGFQVLKINSFQQLCINFTNQRLQQLYIQQVFKAEKKIFDDEGLNNYIETIQFKDNESLLDLLDSNQFSIFNLLDEVCSVATPDQQSFLTRIRYYHKKNEYFPASNLNTNSNILIVRHTPRQVEYNVSGFRQKNKNLLRDDVLFALKSSKLPMILQMFTDDGGKQNNLSSNSNKIKRYLGSKFRSQMNQLTKQLQNLSDLHFMRCIKSNNNKQEETFDNKVALQQIKYLGILDSIKIRKQSYCIRNSYDKFCKMYEWYRKDFMSQVDPVKARQQTMNIIKKYFNDLTNEDLLFGTTKLFLKAHTQFRIKHAYNKFIKNLKAKVHILTSAMIRGIYVKKKKLKISNYNKIAQYFKSFVEQVRMYRRKKAVLIIQKAWIRKNNKQYLRNYRMSAIIIQSSFRTAIETLKKNKKLQATKKIQNAFRIFLKRKKLFTYSNVLDIINKKILFEAWLLIKIRRGMKIGIYINTLTCLIRNKQSIEQFNNNAKIKEKKSSIKKIQKFLKGIIQSRKLQKYLKIIYSIQNRFRTNALRAQFLRLRKSAIIIQRYFRQFYFQKIQSHRIFKKFFEPYNNGLKMYNQRIRSILFGTRKSKYDEQLYIDDIIKNYIGKFNSKMTIFYYMIDIQNFIQLSQIYPNNSWVKNYLKLYKQNFDKNTFIQQIQVGETFSTCATSNKLYSWGSLLLNNQKISVVNLHGRVSSFKIKKDELQIQYQNKKKPVQKYFETTRKKYKFANHIFYQKKRQQYIPFTFKVPQKIIEVACGNGHIICRTYLKKILTWGHGKEGQLGHGLFVSEQRPKSIVFFQKNNLFAPLQVAASYSSSIVLMSNRKIYWFGKNGTIQNVSVPVEINLLQKNNFIGNSELFTPIRVMSSWSRSQSIIGLTILSYNNVLDSNVTLRSKIVNMIINKWHQAGIQQVNSPFIKNIANYMSQCNVKMPISKPIIEMESKRALKELQQEIRLVLKEQPLDISFSQNITGDNPLFK